MRIRIPLSESLLHVNAECAREVGNTVEVQSLSLSLLISSEHALDYFLCLLCLRNGGASKRLGGVLVEVCERLREQANHQALRTVAVSLRAGIENAPLIFNTCSTLSSTTDKQPLDNIIDRTHSVAYLHQLYERRDRA